MSISLRIFAILSSLAGVCGTIACGPPPVASKKSVNRTELAKDFLARHELPYARREAQKALELDAGNAEAHTILGLVEFLDALNNFRLLEIDNCLTGVDAEGLQQDIDIAWQKASLSFGRAAKIDPGYSEAIKNQAKVAELLEDFERSITLYERALELPHRLLDLSLTRADLGWARFRSGDVVGAAKDLRKALQFNDTMCVAKYRLGRVYFEREEWNNAHEQFQAVVGSDDCGTQEAHLYLIRTMKQLSTMNDATAFDFQSAVNACAALAPKSCIAAECKAGV